MIRRIVKMEFLPEHKESFIQIFKESRPTILTMPGCKSVSLLRDVKKSEVMFTLSDWESEADLDFYRSTAFFLHTWKKTKALFATKAVAWTTEEV